MGNAAASNRDSHVSVDSDSYMKSLETSKVNPLFDPNESVNPEEHAHDPEHSHVDASTDPKDFIQVGISEEECASFLRQQAEGAFVIYLAPNQSSEYTMAVRSAGSIRHNQVVNIPELGFSLSFPGSSEQPVFSEISRLLAYYQQPHPGVPFVLLLDNPLFSVDGAGSHPNTSIDSSSVIPRRRTFSIRPESAEMGGFVPTILNTNRDSLVEPDPAPSPPVIEKVESIPHFAKLVKEAVAKSRDNLFEV